MAYIAAKSSLQQTSGGFCDFTRRTRSEKYGHLPLTALHACPELWKKLDHAVYDLLDSVEDQSDEYVDAVYTFGRESGVPGFEDIFFF
jgi:hypothetical protein